MVIDLIWLSFHHYTVKMDVLTIKNKKLWSLVILAFIKAKGQRYLAWKWSFLALNLPCHEVHCNFRNLKTFCTSVIDDLWWPLMAFSKTTAFFYKNLIFVQFYNSVEWIFEKCSWKGSQWFVYSHDIIDNVRNCLLDRSKVPPSKVTK